MNKISRTLAQIRELSVILGWDPEDVFMSGECGSLALLMKEIFKEIHIYGLYFGFELQHILIYYDGVYYDINGEFTIYKFVKQFNKKVGYKILKEKNFHIGENELTQNEIYMCCGNYSKLTGNVFDSQMEISNLYELLKNRLE